MAHSRPPPPTRSVTSPPLSPVATEKPSKNGSSKQSSKSSKPDGSKTRSSRPGTSSRRTTPQYMARTNSSQGSKNTASRERDREREEKDRYDEAETFLQFCSFCEKQIDGSAGAFLYCSESCRVRDLYTAPHSHHAHSSRSSSATLQSPPQSPSLSRGPISTYYPTDGPDIIPRASPTIPRPRSYFNSDPFPYAPINVASSASNHQSQSQTHTSSKSATSSAHGSTSALASLRELSAALETSKSQSNYDRSDSEGDDYSAPTSPLSRSQNNSAVWSYNPFTSYSTAIPSTPKQITRSYTQPASNGAGYGASAGYSYARFGSTSGASTYGGMDRPLPPRSGGYGHRPRSMDLVTPFSGGA